MLEYISATLKIKQVNTLLLCQPADLWSLCPIARLASKQLFLTTQIYLFINRQFFFYCGSHCTRAGGTSR